MSILITVSCFMFIAFFCQTKAFSSSIADTTPESELPVLTQETVQGDFLLRIENTESVPERDDQNVEHASGCIR